MDSRILNPSPNAQKQRVTHRPFHRACGGEISREDEGYVGRRTAIKTNTFVV